MPLSPPLPTYKPQWTLSRVMRAGIVVFEAVLVLVVVLMFLGVRT